MSCIELKEQKIMLDHLDTDMDQAGEKMNFVIEKLGKLLKTKNNCQLCTIIILTLILVILSKLIVFLLFVPFFYSFILIIRL